MAYQSQDIIRRSATNEFTPRLRRGTTSRRWRSLSTSPPVSAAKPVRWPAPEWNDIRDEVGHNVGVCDNPADPTAKSWTVMRFSEVEQNDKLEWLIRKDGCMHCADPGCLKACPSERRDHSVRQRHCRLPVRAVHRLRLLYRRLSVRCTASEPGRQPRLQMYPVRRPRDRRPEPACVKTCPTGAIHFGSKEDMKTLAGERVAELKTRGYDNAGLYDPAGVGGTHVMYVLHHADKPNLYHGLPENRRSARPSSSGKASGNRWRPSASPRPSQPVSSTTSASVRTARKRKRTIRMKRKTRCANEKT